MRKCIGLLLLTGFSLSASADQEPLEVKFGTQDEFYWGLATAPAHVEDDLQDTWLDFARNGGVAAFDNQVRPADRLKFWTNPEVEIDLAAKTGVTVFRMGVDWGRLVPTRQAKVDPVALARYVEIIKMVRAKKMRVMLTLFHHSLPRWALDLGGWKNPKVKESFVNFGKEIAKEFSSYVDQWVIFNEPAVFSALTYVAGIWPGGKNNPFGMVMIPGKVEGDFFTAVNNMTAAHRDLYDYIHEIDKDVADVAFGKKRPAVVGIAHNVGHQLASTKLDKAGVYLTQQLLNYKFLDDTINHLDFIGVNYYGSEIVNGPSVAVDPRVEYSESGRVVNPRGMYVLLKQLHERYNVKLINRNSKEVLPFVITENGVSDSTDWIRPAYFLEHMRAIDAARKEGVQINGYVFWTISDNWEWADGYCPKFGMVGVEREKDLNRVLRPSYQLFTDVVSRGGITKTQLSDAYQLVRTNVGNNRPFCRAADGKSSFDEPGDRAVVDMDWRFKKERVIQFEGGGPYEVDEIPVQDIKEQLASLKDGAEMVVSNLAVFLQAYSDVQIDSDAGKVKMSLHEDAYITCTSDFNGFPVLLRFDTQFELSSFRQIEDGKWKVKTKGMCFNAKRFVDSVNIDEMTLNGTQLNFSMWGSAPLLNRVAAVDLADGSTTVSCVLEQKKPGEDICFGSWR